MGYGSTQWYSIEATINFLAIAIFVTIIIFSNSRNADYGLFGIWRGEVSYVHDKPVYTPIMLAFLMGTSRILAHYGGLQHTFYLLVIPKKNTQKW